ncbi:MAG: hypothetical protein QG671_1493 [Actinomycetota bacterium]|nr:hypothetical protein [Actinomycetota bacterium]
MGADGPIPDADTCKVLDLPWYYRVDSWQVAASHLT